MVRRTLNKSSRHNSAFTLIELLVVVSIIALLVSILLPALGRARQHAQRAVCGSNLHQIGLMHEYYAEDNDGYFPCSNTQTGYFYLIRVLGDYLEAADPVWHCPSDKRMVGDEPRTPSYRYNRALTNKYGISFTPVSLKVGSIRMPGTVVATLDDQYDATVPDDRRQHTVETNHGFIPYPRYNPHSNGANVLLVDGHVEWVQAPPERLHTYQGLTFFPHGN